MSSLVCSLESLSLTVAHAAQPLPQSTSLPAQRRRHQEFLERARQSCLSLPLRTQSSTTTIDDLPATPHPAPFITYPSPPPLTSPCPFHCTLAALRVQLRLRLRFCSVLLGRFLAIIEHVPCASLPLPLPLPLPLRHLLPPVALPRPAPAVANLAEPAKRLIVRAQAPCIQGEPTLAQVLRRSRLSRSPVATGYASGARALSV